MEGGDVASKMTEKGSEDAYFVHFSQERTEDPERSYRKKRKNKDFVMKEGKILQFFPLGPIFYQNLEKRTRKMKARVKIIALSATLMGLMAPAHAEIISIMDPDGNVRYIKTEQNQVNAGQQAEVNASQRQSARRPSMADSTMNFASRSPSGSPSGTPSGTPSAEAGPSRNVSCHREAKIIVICHLMTQGPRRGGYPAVWSRVYVTPSRSTWDLAPLEPLEDKISGWSDSQIDAALARYALK